MRRTHCWVRFVRQPRRILLTLRQDHVPRSCQRAMVGKEMGARVTVDMRATLEGTTEQRRRVILCKERIRSRGYAHQRVNERRAVCDFLCLQPSSPLSLFCMYGLFVDLPHHHTCLALLLDSGRSILSASVSSVINSSFRRGRCECACLREGCKSM